MDKDDDDEKIHEDIGEKLHRAHERLDAADRELAEIADLIDEVVERELEEAGVRTITNLHDGSVTIQLPTDFFVAADCPILISINSSRNAAGWNTPHLSTYRK